MEDEEDIFVGDIVTCSVKVVHENLLPENVSAKDVIAGTAKWNESEESEEESEKTEEEKGEKPKLAMTIDELDEMEAHVKRLHIEPGVVHSKK